MELKTVDVPLQMVRVYAQCGNCGARLDEPLRLPGAFKRENGLIVLARPERYRYTCQQCGERSDADECYPRIEYRET